MKTVAPQHRSVMPFVSLATAVRSKRWFEDTKKASRKFRAGGRCGTIHMTIESFARKVGEPHKRAGQYRDYDGIDGAGSWRPFIHQYTALPDAGIGYCWNTPSELSVRATDGRHGLNQYQFC